MNVPAWQVSNWNPVRRTAREWARSAVHLRPLSSSTNVDGDAGNVRFGQVLWAGSCDGEMVGLAWDWREVRDNVIALADPMMVLSNLELVDDAGMELTESHRLICLNDTIYRLEWQQRLARPHALAAQRLAA